MARDRRYLLVLMLKFRIGSRRERRLAVALCCGVFLSGTMKDHLFSSLALEAVRNLCCLSHIQLDCIRDFMKLAILPRKD